METIILPLKNLPDNDLNNIIKRVGSKVLNNIRKLMKKFENDDFEEIDESNLYMNSHILLPQVSCATKF
jgi:phosphate uptake regulator